MRVNTWGRVNLSAEELERSLSCQRTWLSKVGMTNPLRILASPQTFSELMGFLFWAMVELPT